MTVNLAIFASRRLTSLILLGGVLLLALAERLVPLRRRKRRQAPRLKVNFLITALAFAAGYAVVRPLALGCAALAQVHSFGLLHLIDLPFWLQATLGFLLMDLTFYYWHRLNHLRPLLWRFHNVHHVDPDMDVTTSFRFHPGEVLYSTAFRLAQAGVLGVSPFIYLTYEVVFNLETAFHHSNLRLPIRVERGLNKIIVTPRMHGIHHSAIGSETNSNFSVIFSWWDRLHDSLRLNVPQGEIVIGVPGYLLPGDNRFFKLLQQPFVKQRPYWRFLGGKAAFRQPVPAGTSNPRILAP